MDALKCLADITLGTHLHRERAFNDEERTQKPRPRKEKDRWGSI